MPEQPLHPQGSSKPPVPHHESPVGVTHVPGDHTEDQKLHEPLQVSIRWAVIFTLGVVALVVATAFLMGGLQTLMAGRGKAPRTISPSLQPFDEPPPEPRLNPKQPVQRSELEEFEKHWLHSSGPAQAQAEEGTVRIPINTAVQHLSQMKLAEIATLMGQPEEGEYDTTQPQNTEGETLPLNSLNSPVPEKVDPLDNRRTNDPNPNPATPNAPDPIPENQTEPNRPNPKTPNAPDPLPSVDEEPPSEL